MNAASGWLPAPGLAWACGHLGAWALMVLAAAGLGDLLLRRCRFHSRVERAVFTIALGLGTYSLTFFVLGLLGGLYRPVIWGLTLAGSCAAAPPIVRLLRSRPWRRAPGERSRSFEPKSVLRVCLVALALAYAGLLLALTQYPPLQWDAIGNHLVLAREYLTSHRVSPVPGLAQPVLPALNHLLFTWAMALLDDVLAQMVEYTLMMLVALGLYSWGKRLDQPALGFALAAAWLAHPLVHFVGMSAYADMGITCYALLGIYALRIFAEGRQASWLLLGLALTGMAAGCKMTGLFFLALALAYSLWAGTRGRVAWPALARGWAIGLLVALPWYGFIAWATGNPLWPFASPLALLPGSGSTTGVAATSAFFGGAGLPKTVLGFLEHPFYLATQQDIFFKDNDQGYLAFVAAWPLACIVAVWSRSVRWWVAWLLAYTAFWFSTASYLRYWLPAVPLVGLCLFEGVSWLMARVGKRTAWQGAFWIAIALLAIVSGAGTALAGIGNRGWPPPSSEEGRRAFLEKLGYGATLYVNRHARADDTVFILGANYLSYYFRPRVTGYLNEIGLDRPTAALVWPADSGWRQTAASQGVTWIFLQHDGWRPPQGPPFRRPGAPAYELVFASARSYVFHRAPLPSALSLGARRLQALHGACDRGPAERTAAYEGNHGEADCAAIDGWVWDAARPNCPLDVDIYEGRRLLARVPAFRPRADLVAAGKGDGNHAFRHPLPAALRDGKRHTLRVKVAGTDTELGHTPKVISCPNDRPWLSARSAGEAPERRP